MFFRLFAISFQDVGPLALTPEARWQGTREAQGAQWSLYTRRDAHAVTHSPGKLHAYYLTSVWRFVTHE